MALFESEENILFGKLYAEISPHGLIFLCFIFNDLNLNVV